MRLQGRRGGLVATRAADCQQNVKTPAQPCPHARRLYTRRVDCDGPDGQGMRIKTTAFSWLLTTTRSRPGVTAMPPGYREREQKKITRLDECLRRLLCWRKPSLRADLQL